MHFSKRRIILGLAVIVVVAAVALEVEAIRGEIPVSGRSKNIIRRTERYDVVLPERALLDLIVIKGELAQGDGQGLDGQLEKGHGESIENTKYRKGD